MNKLIVAVFNTEAAADQGLQALHTLHSNGDISLYATGVLVKDAHGVVSIKHELGAGTGGAVAGLAVGGLIGLLGGPVGVAIGAVAGTVVGAVRDFWVAGVGLDFVEEIEKIIQPGKVALVAEIEEEWVTPVDIAIEAAGGDVFRRTRIELSEAQFDHDIAAFKSEIKDLETEASHASGDAKAKLKGKLDSAKTHLDRAVHRTRHGVDQLKKEADAKLEALNQQLSHATGDVKTRIEGRIDEVKRAYHVRGEKLSQAWALTKEAFSA